MRCRSIYDNNIVWFGSAGLDMSQPVYDNEGQVIGYKSIKHNNFSTEQQSVADSLTQRLSILKYELWYNMQYGLPLFDNVKSKIFMDSSVTSIITSHPDVVRIESFSSSVINKHYTFSCVVLSIYGIVNINSSEISV